MSMSQRSASSDDEPGDAKPRVRLSLDDVRQHRGEIEAVKPMPQGGASSSTPAARPKPMGGSSGAAIPPPLGKQASNSSPPPKRRSLLGGMGGTGERRASVATLVGREMLADIGGRWSRTCNTLSTWSDIAARGRDEGDEGRCFGRVASSPVGNKRTSTGRRWSQIRLQTETRTASDPGAPPEPTLAHRFHSPVRHPHPTRLLPDPTIPSCAPVSPVPADGPGGEPAPN